VSDTSNAPSANVQRPPGVCLHCEQEVTWSLQRGAYATQDGTGSIVCRTRGRDSIGRSQTHELDAHGGGVL
jgi:hypothetical protein